MSQIEDIKAQIEAMIPEPKINLRCEVTGTDQPSREINMRVYGYIEGRKDQ